MGYGSLIVKISNEKEKSCALSLESSLQDTKLKKIYLPTIFIMKNKNN